MPSLAAFHPRPGAIQLSLPAELLTASMLNVLGQVVHIQVLIVGAAERTLALPSLAAGVYTLRLETRQGSIGRQLVIE